MIQDSLDNKRIHRRSSRSELLLLCEMTSFTTMQPQTCSRVSQLAGSPVRHPHRACFSASRRAFSVRASGNGSRVDKFDKHSIIVSPSILSADFAKLGEQVLLTKRTLACLAGELRSRHCNFSYMCDLAISTWPKLAQNYETNSAS